MKVCPKCAQSFADGFRYCPKDATELVKYDLRASIQDRQELQLLIERRSLLSRLKLELADACSEMKRNPLKFIAALLRGERSSRRRQRLLTAGFATAVSVYSVIIISILLAGIIKFRLSDQEVIAGPPPDLSFNDGVRLVIPPDPTQMENTKRGSGLSGGSLKTPRDPGGGGGNEYKLRTSKGIMPLPSRQPINLPDFELPKEPKFIVPETVNVDPAFLRRLKGPIGVPAGQIEIPSLGQHGGPGVGDGKGAGYGPGLERNRGNGLPTDGGGPVKEGNEPGFARGNVKPTILYKEKAPYTEAARINKVQGRVVLNLVFGADGAINNIRVVQGLSYGLTESAIQAAQRIRFAPAMENGKPVSVRVNVEFNFALY
jgi:TonB family protein